MWVPGETFYLKPNEFSSNSAKTNADQGAFPHTENDCSTLLSVDMSQAKNGELLIVVHSMCLRCTHIPCLSTEQHLRFSYRMKILPVVVSVVFCY